MRKVLYVAHNHPSVRPGGMEIYADELHRAVGQTDGYESVFVSRVAEPAPGADARARFAAANGANGDPGLIYLHTRDDEFDPFLQTATDKRLYVHDWRAFVRRQRPDIVHFHHALFLGWDMIRETRRTLAGVPIVFTLHDFGPICHHHGQMVRTGSHAPCSASSAVRCHACFPDISAHAFLRRERFVKAAMALVDLFVVPSEHARRAFVDWGLDPAKVVHEDYGRIPVAPLPDPPDAGGRGTIGYFGQVTRFKGIDVLLEAMARLRQAGQTGVRLTVFASGIERVDPQFRARLQRQLEQAGDSVRFHGRYEQTELPELMSGIDWVVVPSIWWETGPLVIHEARLHRRPVICSDIGAMVERVADGVNGLLFRAGDPASLARAIDHGAGDPGLWRRLQAGITQPPGMAAHVTRMLERYDELRARRRAPRAA